ncbi:MAG: polysaccharide deacetylase family protein [Actinomycetota bacterium]|nr:polysaccharide deacetylase family protein [Actinomycetota bacterium]
MTNFRRPAAAGTVVLGAGVLVHLVPGVTSWRRARCLLAPRLSGVGDPRHVALTFDDGPDPVSTPSFLDELDRLGWQATFFVLGSQIRKDVGLTAEIAARGHELAVHGDRHVSHLRRPYPWTVDDVTRCRDTVAEILGFAPRWFRPPYGAVSASTLVAAKKANLQLVLWTSWGRDWRPQSTPASVTADVTRTLRPGATVLLHDSDDTSAPDSWRAALGALPELADRWDAAGLQVGPLGEHGLADTRRILAPSVRVRS